MIPELATIAIGLLIVAFFGYVLACTTSGRYEPILLTWALLAPLGYAVLAYPHQRSIITLHRVVILPLLILIPLLPPSAIGRMDRKLKWLAIAWAFFVFGAMLSLINVPDGQILSAARVAVDAFVLPPLLAFVVFKTFRVRQHLPWIHLIICLVSIYLSIIGLLEIFTGRALMPQAGAGDVLYAGGSLLQIVRPTGPYANPATFSLVGMINLFLLLFCRRAMGKLHAGTRFLHALGIVASVLVALMTFTRGAVVAFLLISVIEIWQVRGIRHRVLRVIGLVGLFAAISLAMIFVPSQITQERSSTDNFWSRVAQQLQTFYVFWDHPLTGVGLCNFGSVTGLTSKYQTSVAGFDSVGTPHNLLGEVLSDTGLMGAIPFIITQCLLLVIFWKFRDSNPASGRFVWPYFVMIFTAYWVLNMDFGIGYYSELNLWFVFALALLYRYAMERVSDAVIVPALPRRTSRASFPMPPLRSQA